MLLDAAQKEEPWKRLTQTKTLASSRREVFHHDPQAPNDSLDFIIKSKYVIQYTLLFISIVRAYERIFTWFYSNDPICVSNQDL